MRYVVNENKERVELERALGDIEASVNSIPAAGVTWIIDEVECYGLSGTVNEVLNIFGKRIGYRGKGDAIFVDKNHDLSYYFTGSDYVNSSDYNQSPGTFGYEWGGYQIKTYIEATNVGTGLSNTNSLISMNLQPDTSGWYVVWDKIKEFRQSHSDNWFLPSKDELNLIYEARSNLTNLSTSTNYYYWSSSEGNYRWNDSGANNAWAQAFSDGDQYRNVKNFHSRRARLCRQY